MFIPNRCCTLRANGLFRKAIHEEHHRDEGDIKSPFEELPIDMVKDFPLDYMHLCVQKKLLLIWLKANLRECLSVYSQNLLSEKLLKIAGIQSRDFYRPCFCCRD